MYVLLAVANTHTLLTYNIQLELPVVIAWACKRLVEYSACSLAACFIAPLHPDR